MRLSMPESSAIGVSGMAAPTTLRLSIFTSMPPSLTRSSCLSSPVTVTKLPCARAEIASAIRSVPEALEGLSAASAGSERG